MYVFLILLQFAMWFTRSDTSRFCFFGFWSQRVYKIPETNAWNRSDWTQLKFIYFLFISHIFFIAHGI